LWFKTLVPKLWPCGVPVFHTLRWGASPLKSNTGGIFLEKN
jgi:hypothetical protein